ncbi:MAG: response regulator [Bacteroidales bacterium]|nr:response regulator [Bacteroidales bacterium]
MKKVILVDHKEIFRKSLIETLKTAGDVEIIGEASNGDEFLKLLTSKQPDIVFMDIEMPIMDGIEATKKALQEYPNLVIIGLSMYDNKSYVEKLMEVGARGYLLKTSDNHEMLKTIIKYPQADIFFSVDLSYKPDKKNKIKNLLIVDDFETNVIVMKSSLTAAGFKVHASSNPQEAYEIAAASGSDFDLIIVDFRMPVMNGAELVTKIRRLPKYRKIPILMLSSETDKEKKLEAKKAGATGWIKKPFQLDKFLRIIEKSL